MTQDILKKLDEKKLNRRSFLRGSGLAVAAFAGVAAMSSLKGFAQQQRQQQEGDKKDDSRKKDDSTDGSEQKQEERVDAQGREYRSCPQCGFNMYRQGRTWTCENCGYSYVE